MNRLYADHLQLDVVQTLLAATLPMSAGEVAITVGARVADAQDALGYLVRHGGARRHHSEDAVMRYSAVRRERKPKPVTPAPKADAVLAAMDAGHVRARDIGAACGLSPVYTSVVLHRLQSKGLVLPLGPAGRAEWRRVCNDDNALPTNLANAIRRPLVDEDGELPPCIGEHMRDTFHEIHRAAFEAQQEAQDHDHDR